MVNIEIDGIPLSVDSSKMIIQAADEAGIDIPRFCYHKKLSIAANCRMCLVEVDKARKALPACATPVTEGMKVFTHSETAVLAQRGVMEFLLINHPLDCPICDQGGECELQDLSVGYGDGVGRFSERKRVVKDKNIGPLIQTDMTRCIHCTRCVRFGQEIAGIKELGATGRGEHMEIGTYIEHSLASELSGNIIDLCPVGALTSKPFRYKARAWELSAHPSVARHDAVGSNIEFHTSRGKVLRVVPRDNEQINETWLSDRDRFSYLGFNHEQRATQPMIKRNGEWQNTDWQTALQAAIDGLKAIKTKHGAEQVASLIAPTATLEEAYLFQKLVRGLGSNNIDHRLRQQDFSDDGVLYSSSDWSLTDIENNDAILLVGCNIRSEQPIIAHRIRQAAIDGTSVTSINFFESDFLMPVEKQVTVDVNMLMKTLSGVAKALLGLKKHAKEWDELLDLVRPTAEDQTIAMHLSNAMTSTVMLGALVNNHPQASKIRALCHLIADLSSAKLIVLPESNSQAMTVAQALPYQANSDECGLNAQQMWQNSCRSYLLFGIEPEYDCADPVSAQSALQQASFVVSINSYVTDTMLSYSDVILPLAGFAETSGTFVNIDNQWQSFTGAVPGLAESRPGWKILRVLGNIAKLDSFDYVSSSDICDEVRDEIKLRSKATIKTPTAPASIDAKFDNVMLISEIPMYQTDAIVRRSVALQNTPESQDLSIARMCSATAEKVGVSDVAFITLHQGDKSLTVAYKRDDKIAENCVYWAGGTSATAELGAAFAPVTVEIAQGANHD
ncbi:MAG: NADH-quinone oxidoreductase subunit NuoG [Gammaproteobacteria bacterium]|nr:NADH-quinone oxidoreductase subunit NuoG [Gammaproteobacteria bacterium]